ncbi:MAG TPA: helical backbone metal receptor [Candidatus Glassbacteria bacterium]|nr:helical backbone metal receptor [Candidatus Glassbacteria bacterium]
MSSESRWYADRRFLVPLVVVVAVLAGTFGRRMLDGDFFSQAERAGRTQPTTVFSDGRLRIVSLAPSITEVLFAIEAGDLVAGVTRYCDYPPEARFKPQIGGYLDPNYEAVVALRVNLAIMLAEQASAAGKMLYELGIDTLVVDQRNLNGIMKSIRRIGEACGRQAQARRLVAGLEGRMERIRRLVAGRERPGVLVVLGRNLTGGDLRGTYIAGNDGFYNDLVELAGGTNSYTGRTIAFPSVSAEGLHQLDPQVIIEVIPNLGETGIDPQRFVETWEFAKSVDAVKNGRVHVFVEDWAVRPGPRFILLAEKMARVIHPEAGREQ